MQFDVDGAERQEACAPPIVLVRTSDSTLDPYPLSRSCRRPNAFLNSSASPTPTAVKKQASRHRRLVTHQGVLTCAG